MQLTMPIMEQNWNMINRAALQLWQMNKHQSRHTANPQQCLAENRLQAENNEGYTESCARFPHSVNGMLALPIPTHEHKNASSEREKQELESQIKNVMKQAWRKQWKTTEILLISTAVTVLDTNQSQVRLAQNQMFEETVLIFYSTSQGAS